jgi:hypothetical protein
MKVYIPGNSIIFLNFNMWVKPKLLTVINKNELPFLLSVESVNC